MALTERRIRYETLIRWHEDGKIGAHQVDLDQVLRDGVVVSSTPTSPIPLATADFDGAVKISDILGEAATTALVQVDTLTSELESAKTEIQRLTDLLAQPAADSSETAEQNAE